jgi:hypothetical protein
MRGPRFTLRQSAIGIAVIGVLLAFWVQNPMSAELLAIASIPVAAGFLIASLVRRGVEEIRGYSMKRPGVLLILIMRGLGLGFTSLAVTILILDPITRRSLVPPQAVILPTPTLLGFVIYLVSQRSLRFRLTVEILTLVGLLTLSAWTWRPQKVIQAAEHADALAAQVLEWTESPNDPKQADALAAQVLEWTESPNDLKTRDWLRRQSQWLRRRAFTLRCQALWYGLIYGPPGYDYYYAYNTEDLVLELGVLEVIEAHKMRAREEDEPVQ